ncbi:MAG TPA: hypothetical protein VK599_12895, partial [Streptosporangiaceae bacterium]|nr:hypothetical protein [Streptosporangiaceae bacterium]
MAEPEHVVQQQGRALARARRCRAATKARLTCSRRTTVSCGSAAPPRSVSLTGSTHVTSMSGGPGMAP